MLNSVKALTKGFNKNSFSALVFLMWTALRRNISFWVLVAITMFVALSATSAISNEYKEGYTTLNEAKGFMGVIMKYTVLLPTVVFSLFTIPGIINGLHKSTMIKRIGATNITESSFITIVWLVFFIITFGIFTSLIIYQLLLNIILFGESLVNGLFLSYSYSIIMIMLFVSIGVFFGTLPVGTALSTTLSITMIIITVMFGGIFGRMSQAFAMIWPWSTILLVLNPISLSSYAFVSMAAGTLGTTLTVMIFIYVIIMSIVMFLASTLLMSFNKIR